MTIGISKEAAKRIGQVLDSIKYLECSIEDRLLDECKELDPWLPIDENTPKNGEEILLCSMFDQAVCYWRDDEVKTGWTWGLENKFLNPIGWKKLSELPRPRKLLPDDPK